MPGRLSCCSPKPPLPDACREVPSRNPPGRVDIFRTRLPRQLTTIVAHLSPSALQSRIGVRPASREQTTRGLFRAPEPDGGAIGTGDNNPGRTERNQAGFPRSRTGTWKMWKSRLLWRTGALETLANRDDEPSFHIKARVCTGVFDPLVGCVGNMGRVGANLNGISKTPEFHSSDLENPSKS